MNVPEGGEEAFDLEKYKRDTEAEFQQYLDIVGRDTPEGKALLLEWEAARAPIPLPMKAEADEIQLIDLRLLVPSPLHRRTGPTPEEATSLERTIASTGLRHPIEVRPLDGGKYEIICGHGRFHAYQALLDGATTEIERAKYQAIPAVVRQGASDLDVVRWGIAEDLARDEFPAADAARSLDLLRTMDPTLNSAQKLSDSTGVNAKRCGRLLQLLRAPVVVQEAARVGVTVDVQGDGDYCAHQEQHQLKLLEAIEFSRLHGALKATVSGSKKHKAVEGDGPSSAEQGSEADRKTREAIERALKEQWGFREVKRYVDKAVAALHPNRPKKVGRPKAPLRWNKKWLQVDMTRLDALNASQKALLRKLIDQILPSL
jgi:ParB-like chromosome segregation protein Spo0J